MKEKEVINQINPESILYRNYPFRVLVVEDEPSWQTILSQSLRICRPEEIDTRFVRNVKQALDLIYNERQFDLVIADYYLNGEMTGFDLWKCCNSQFFNIPFIVITGKKRIIINNEKLEAGAKFPLVIQKPFDIKYFKSIIDLYLNR